MLGLLELLLGGEHPWGAPEGQGRAGQQVQLESWHPLAPWGKLCGRLWGGQRGRRQPGTESI